MAKVHYVECSLCGKEYYVDRILYEAWEANPDQKFKCPFCKRTFRLEAKQVEKREAKA